MEEAYFHSCIYKEKKKTTNQAKTTKSHPAQSTTTSICEEQGCTVNPSRAGAHNAAILLKKNPIKCILAACATKKLVKMKVYYSVGIVKYGENS